MNTKHTPGPWTVIQKLNEGHKYLHFYVKQAGKEDDVTRIMRTQNEANARLIAAAPELLDACIQVLATIEGKHEHTVLDKGRMMKLRAAIAKATSA